MTTDELLALQHDTIETLETKLYGAQAEIRDLERRVWEAEEERDWRIRQMNEFQPAIAMAAAAAMVCMMRQHG